MAQYKLIEPEIRTVEEGKQNAGKKYLVAKLVNKLCIWDEPQTFACFNDVIVNAYINLLPINKGGIAEAAQPIPQEMAEITGHWVDYIPEQKFYKQHLSSHSARLATATSVARPAIKVGDLVGKNGIPTIFSKLRVFCIYFIDEEGERNYVRGGSPEEVGQRAFQSYCIPIDENRAPQPVAPTSGNPEHEPIPEVHASSNQPQPMQQPAQQAAQPVAPANTAPTFTQQGAAPATY